MNHVTTAAGEMLPVPEALEAVVDAAIRASRDRTTTYAEWRTAFASAVVEAFHDKGLILVARGFAQSREMVSANTYSLAVAAKNHQERTVHALREIFRGDACRGDLHAEFHALVLALTGHAPLEGVGRAAGVDERLRQLRELLLGVPLDQAAADLPAPASPAELAR
jgi:hypothetical protein